MENNGVYDYFISFIKLCKKFKSVPKEKINEILEKKEELLKLCPELDGILESIMLFYKYKYNMS